ncbi:ATP-grasp fold amidoligase family protein [Ectothiorhodospira variabilis]|uniref:ATP-grasp fold amidoligase family protein n=1 Tax=Ectothiorhodospira variabilis TaxID=505694 RepID=UPI001EFB8D32|nr:ATP-grasp fold amidoligase family protein [Ectothiorhodospira variabilis]MCG5497789.1 hypothetical protein [Ectothiorhodospira variabilis]
MSIRAEKLKHRLRMKWWRLIDFPSNYDEMLDYEMRTDFKYTREKAHVALGYQFDLKRPRSFNEKATHRRLFDRNPVWPIVTEKVSARTWIKEKQLDKHVRLIPMVSTFSDPALVRELDCSGSIFIKAAWASGQNIKISTEDSHNLRAIEGKLTEWLGAEYHPKRLVWAQTQMPRRFIAEHDLSKVGDLAPLCDYKFFVFHGKVRLVQVWSGSKGNRKVTHFDPKGNHLDIRRVGKENGNHRLPEQFAQLILSAEKVGGYFDFVRVDLYVVDGDIYFGEITQTPANGFSPFDPCEFDFELGSYWNYEN